MNNLNKKLMVIRLFY